MNPLDSAPNVAENQAQIMVFETIQELLTVDEMGRWYLDFDKNSQVLEDLCAFVTDDPGQAMATVCVALQCAGMWFGKLVDGNPKEILLDGLMGLLSKDT